MKNKSIQTDETSGSFFKVKSYYVEEIMAAGGTTAFANKLGKKPELLADKLAKLPADAFLTEEEFEQAMKTLRENK